MPPLKRLSLFARSHRNRILLTVVGVGLGALFVFLRARWVGHLVIWDEAMNLCALRAFVTQSHDTFANWFWRHPPLFCLGMALLRPLAEGFAERVEWLAIALGLVNAALLCGLNRRVFDRTTAAWSVFCLAVQPAAMFYGVWVKRDHLAATFGLLALLLASRRRLAFAGLALGLSFLSKETAVFYVVPLVVGLLWARRPWRDWIVLFAPMVLCMAWWYMEFATGHHVTFAAGRHTGWANGTFFYVTNVPRDLGYVALTAAIGGAVVLARTLVVGSRPRALAGQWALALLVPTYGLLALLPSKVPWVTAVCAPAWATLSAVGIVAAMRAIGVRKPHRAWRCVLGAAVCAGLMIGAWRCDYDRLLRGVSADQWRGAHWSYEIARQAVEHVGADDRLLLTSFHYWRGVPPGHPCPVFAWYFAGRAPVLLRPHDRSFAEYRADIQTYQLTRAILSPIPGENEADVFDGFIRQLGLTPVRMERAFLFNTAPLLETATSEEADAGVTP